MIRRIPALAAAALLAGTACGDLLGAPGSTGLAPVTIHAAATPSASAASPVPCTDPTLSLRPDPAGLPRAGSLPSGSYAQQIYNRGRVIAGIAQDTLMFGYLDPLDNKLKGFDIDLVRQLSQAVFGDDLHVEYRVITPGQAYQALRDGTVDVVARTLPMTCRGWQQVDYSAAYFEAGQRVMVPKASTVQGIGDLGGKRVCAPSGTTALENIAAANAKSKPVGLTDQTDCLVQLELGTVDAISSDDALLTGLAAQDPNVRIVGPRFATLPYGIGISRSHPDFVRYVNALLEQLRGNGVMTRLYQEWLGPLSAYDPATPPTPRYQD